MQFSIWRTLKIGLFHVGSAFADLLGSAVWNRVMIDSLGVAATPVALLSALRYLLAPLSIWAGYRSDTRPLFGLRRLPYIWIGRALMLLALPLLPLATLLIAQNTRSLSGWLVAFGAFLIYGIGSLTSGGPFLALVRDSAPPEKAGMALSVVQTVLVVSFAFSPIVYSLLMPDYSPALFWQVTLVGVAVALLFWLVPLLGEEPRRVAPAATPEPFLPVLRSIWADHRTRAFFFFLSLGAASGFMQDAILEPMGAQVFGLSVGATTRFNAYWGVGVLLGMVGTTVLTRRRRSADQEGTTRLGLLLTAASLALLSAVTIARLEPLLVPALTLFGLGFGIYTIGALSLLTAMTPDQHAGAYLGLWSVAQLVFRGIGIGLGGILRDLMLALSGSLPLAYGWVFLLEAFGLLACLILLARADVRGFAEKTAPSSILPLALAD